MTNTALVAQLGLPGFDDPLRPYWTIEDAGAVEGYAWAFNPNGYTIEDNDVSGQLYVLPVRKVNFYGLPLIDSEFGGGWVYDVVAATRDVKIIPHWGDVVGNTLFMWDNAMNYYPSLIGNETFTALPTRAEALKIFNNTYLCALAGMFVGVEYSYWTSEEYDANNAYACQENCVILYVDKTSEFYALPVRSETV